MASPGLTTGPSFGNCSPYDSSIFVAVAGVTAAANFISLLANILVLFFIILFKRWSFFNQRLVLYLSLATIAGNVAGVLARVDYQNQTGQAYDNFCVFSGLLQQITSWMVLNAYICITTSLLMKAYFTIDLEKLDIVTILFIFASPVAINWIPLINKGYGPSGAWCWIRSVERSTCENYYYGVVLQLVLWYIPLYVVLGILIIIYSVVMIKLCLHRRKWKSLDPQAMSERRQALTYTLSLLAYPVIYFVANIFPLINRLQGLTKPRDPSPVLWFLSGIIYHQQGPGIAVAFLVSIRNRLNRVSITAAFAEWFHKVKIEEYPMSSDVREPSVGRYRLYKNEEYSE